MKYLNVLLVVAVVLLSLLALSCVGTAQPTGGWSGPVVHDGVIYVGSKDGRVIAINASAREEKWRWPRSAGVRGLIYTTPIVDGDLIYIGTYAGEVYALNSADGEEEWVYPPKGEGYIGAVVGTPVAANGVIYVTSSDGKVYALNTTTGKRKWETGRISTGKLWTSPAVAGDTLYVSTYDGRIHALSTEAGKLLDWSFQANAGFASSPVVYEGTIYVGSFDRHLYAIEIGTNVFRWKFPEDRPASNWFWACPIVKEGIVYAGCLDGRIYAINATTGKEIWSYATRDVQGRAAPIVSPPVLMDNMLVVVNESGTVYSFDLNAEFGDGVLPSRSVSIGASVRSPFCAQDGLVYVRGENNSLYAVDIAKGVVVGGWPVSLAAEK